MCTILFANINNYLLFFILRNIFFLYYNAYVLYIYTLSKSYTYLLDNLLKINLGHIHLSTYTKKVTHYEQLFYLSSFVTLNT